MTFEVKPEILTIDKVDGLNTEFNALSANTANLLAQTNNLGGSIPELSKTLSVTINKDVVVATAYNGISAYSSDGQTFTINSSLASISDSWFYVPMYTKNMFFICNANGQTAYSKDGINWSPGQTLAIQNYYLSVAYGNNRIMVVDGLGNTFFSTDGLNWTQGQKLPSSAPDYMYYWAGLIFGKDKFVIKNKNRIAYSQDGTSWNFSLPFMDTDWGMIYYIENKFVVLSTNGYVAYSEDGVTWSLQSNGESNSPAYFPSNISYGNGYYIALDREIFRIARSTNGINWSTINNDSIGGSFWRGTAYGNGIFVANNAFGTTRYSVDGYTWTFGQQLNGSDFQFGPIFANGKFIVFGNSYYAYSSNGAAWTTVNIPSGYAWRRPTSGSLPFEKTFSEILGVN